MCFTKRKVKQIKKKYRKNAKVYPELEDNIDDKIKCSGCNQRFSLESNEIKINCAGCDRFFHCCIAGKCVGPNCKNQDTGLGRVHQLSWCIYCVPGISANKVGGKDCICHECYELKNHDSK